MFKDFTGIERIFIFVIFAGAVVDIFQFTWLVKKWCRDAKRTVYDRVRKEILLKQFESMDESPFPIMEEIDGIREEIRKTSSEGSEGTSKRRKRSRKR